MMKITREMAGMLVDEAMPALASPDLRREEAETLVETSVRFLTGVDHLDRAVEEAQLEKHLDPALAEVAADLADRSRWFGVTLQTQAIVQVKRLGGNANLILYEAQKAHS